LLAAKGLILLAEPSLYWLYPAKAMSVAFVLLFFLTRYREIDMRDLSRIDRTAMSILTGLLVFILWVHMDWQFATAGKPQGFNPRLLSGNFTRTVLITSRFFGLVIVVPVMEELFWRSFLIRYIIDSDFMKVTPGRFTWSSFIISTLLFGTEHHLILAGVMAGVAYNIVLYRTRSIAQCIIAHAVTNLALGIYVMYTGKWYFW
jgi:CAAX prenyl protease-like protein